MRLRLPAALTSLLLLAPLAALAQTAVPRWQHLFRPNATGTFSPGILAARELADGTVMVLTDSLIAYRYDHDGNPVSAVSLRGSRPAPAPRPPEPPHLADGGIYSTFGTSFAVIDAFGVVVLSRVGEPGYGVILTGDTITMKFDGLTGRALWGQEAVYDTGRFNADFPTGLFVDGNGDVIVTGISNINGGIFQHVTLKYSGRDGSALWGPVLIFNVADTGTAAVDFSGNIWVSVGQFSGYVSRIRTQMYLGVNGAVLWSPIQDEGADNQVPNASTIDSGNDFVVVGNSGGKAFAIKYDHDDGSVSWANEYDRPSGTSFATFLSLASAASGGLLVGGYGLDASQEAVPIASKLSGATGQIVWNASPIPDAVPGWLAASGNGDAIFSGPIFAGTETRLAFWRHRGGDGVRVWGPAGVDPTETPGPATWLIGSNGRVFVAQRRGPVNAATTQVYELDGSTGEPVWGPTPILPLPNEGFGDLADLSGGPDGSVAVVGNDRLNGSMLTFKYSRSDGSLIWGPSVLELASGWQSAVASNGDVIALSEGASVVRYSAADGSVVWGPTVIPAINARRMALDPNEDIVVLLSSTDPGGSQYHTGVAKISGATGAVLWGPVVYASDPSYGDYPRALAVSPSGDVFVAGDTQGATYSWFVLKYAGSDGSLLWGPETSVEGSPNGAASDADGNLVMVGSSTVKFDGASGAVLWGPLPLQGADGDGGFGRAVVIDSSGDAFVAGDVTNVPTRTDLATIRYRGSDGATVWGPVYFDGDANSYEFPYDLGVGLDGSGNVVVGGRSRRLRGYDDLVLLKYDGGTGATLWGPVYTGGPENEAMTGFSVFGSSVVIGGPSSGALLIAGFDESFGIQTLPPDPPPASCGNAYLFDLTSSNGTGPSSWTVSSGALPQGMTLSSTGVLSGQPFAQGIFGFTAQATDGVAGSVSRAFEIVVGEGSGYRGILQNVDACQVTLSWPASNHLWLPGGETTDTITVSPIETTTYGLLVTDESGCVEHRSVTVTGTILQDSACLGVVVESVAPGSGPAEAGTALAITGLNFQPGASVIVGGSGASDVVVVDSTQITATTPDLTAGTFNDVLVVNPDTGNGALIGGFYADFDDVPPADPFWSYIATLVKNGITAGCGGGDYCPTAPVTRAQMAVFLLRSLYGPAYMPPPSIGYFNDVPTSDPFAPWIDRLFVLGVTTGCGNGNYCPSSPVTRAQMAVFLLKTREGSSYDPPPAVGTFGDVPASDPFAKWIEEIYVEGITGGCSASPLLYCPGSSVTRGQMAAFLVKTFGLE